MGITVADIAKLRAMTGAGMMDCKNALIEANGDFERAQEIIREKGKLIASKRADRSATEGLVIAKVIDNKAYMLSLACETDFVAMGDDFVATTNNMLETAINDNIKDVETLRGRFEAEMTALSGKTGEKVELPFYAQIEGAQCVAYVHTNKKLGAIVAFDKVVSEEVAKDIAMQATAMAPVAIDKDDIDPELIEKEHRIGMEQARLEGKPENLLERIADGKVAKFVQESTLLNQAFVKDNKMTVREYITKAGDGATVVALKRFSLTE